MTVLLPTNASPVNIAPVQGADPLAENREEDLRAAAEDFEAAFVRQMLEHAGFAEAFGTGQGPSADALSSFLLDHLANDVVKNGSFGLAEKFHEYLSVREPFEQTDRGRRV